MRNQIYLSDEEFEQLDSEDQLSFRLCPECKRYYNTNLVEDCHCPPNLFKIEAKREVVIHYYENGLVKLEFKALNLDRSSLAKAFEEPNWYISLLNKLKGLKTSILKAHFYGDWGN